MGLYPVIQATGAALFEAVENCLSEYELSLTDCVGLACDGASSMIGVHNSVSSRITQKCPNCILNKCVCHSLALCVQKAFEHLPSNLGFLLAEIPNWLSNSVIRRCAYKLLFKEMNEEDQESNLPFLKMCGTRWLVRGRVIKRVLGNWITLKSYFLSAMHESVQDARYKARMIHDMLADDINYLYFVFVSPIVAEFERINAFFQSINADPEKMHSELDIHHRSL